MAKKRELKLHVYGQRRTKPDARRIARAIVRLAVEMDAEQAQVLADTLEHEEALQRTALTRQRRDIRAAKAERRQAEPLDKESA